MITDEQLVDVFNFWLEHFKNRGARHYTDTPDWKIQELYYDVILDRILDEIAVEAGTSEEIIERLNNLV